MKFRATLLIDEELLLKAYTEGNGLGEEDCPSIKEMVESELMWGLQSGIDLIGDIVKIES